MESAETDQTDYADEHKALDRAMFGDADERARLEKLAKCYRKAIGEVCFLQANALTCMSHGDFRVPNVDDMIHAMDEKLDMVKMLLAHYDSVHDLSYRGRLFQDPGPQWRHHRRHHRRGAPLRSCL